MSIEAMAMAGMDYKECAISLEEYWDPQPPLYLQVERNVFVDGDVEWMKAKLREWAKAVASKQEDTEGKPKRERRCKCCN